MAENPFRILLDFRKLNFKFYKFVWMSISPRELVTIKDLKEAILKKFSFERTDLLLYLRDGLLPEDENISNILRENDNVRLFYTEPCNVQGHSRTDLNASRTFNYEGVDESSNADQVKSPMKRKEHSDSSEDNNEQIESNKKRKHSFSNGTYSFTNNSTPENPVLISAASGDIETITNVDLHNFENSQSESRKIKKKLKYSHGISQNSLASENEIVLTTDSIPLSEKNQSKINFCKKKKKHKHSKDVSENEIAFHDDIVRLSEINETKSRLHKKKKKHKHSLGASKMDSMSESAVFFHDELIGSTRKLNDSLDTLETRNEVSELSESVFQTVIDDSEILKLAPISLSASSFSSGIGNSLKTSQESNQKMSSEQNCSKYISDSKPISKMDENNLSPGQGNNCKKKKRKRHRKKKSLLIDPQVDVSNDYNLDMTSPQKNGNSDSLFQTPEISSSNKEMSVYSKSDAFYFKRKEPFGSYLPSTSTPFSQSHVTSPRKNVLSKMPSSSIASQDKSCPISLKPVLPAIQKTMDENYLSARSSPCSVTMNKKNTTVPNQNFHEKNLSTWINNSDKSVDSEGTGKAVNSQTDELETRSVEPEVKEGKNGEFENTYKDEIPSCEVIGKNENYLSASSSSYSDIKNKNIKIPNHNFHENSSSTKIDNSDKSTDSFSNIRIKSRFLDPSFSYKGCPPLNSCPLVGTRIAYKMLELDASYSPVVSNYKEGIVKAVNPQTDALEIELIEPEVKEGRIGKFENVYKDELPTCEVVRKVTLSWTSLIDPVRVIY